MIRRYFKNHLSSFEEYIWKYSPSNIGFSLDPKNPAHKAHLSPLPSPPKNPHYDEHTCQDYSSPTANPQS